MWWERCEKGQLKKETLLYEAERQRDYITMENHLYECIYDILCSDIPPNDKRPHLNRYKAKLLRLQAGQMQTDLLHTSVHDCLEEQEPLLYHIILTKTAMGAARQQTGDPSTRHSLK
jgi:hypothetical protein